MDRSIFGQWGRQFSPAARGSLYYFGLSGASATFLPFINVFYAERGLSGRQIGLLSAVGPVVALLAAPLLVAFADRRGWQVQMMIAGLAGVALTTLLIPLAQPFAVLLAVVVGNSLIGSTVGSISDGTIAQMATQHRIDYGKMRLWGSAGWVAMSLLGGFLWPLSGLWLMFPLASLLFVATMFAGRLLLGEAGEDTSSPKGRRRPLRLTSRTARFGVVVICAVLMSLGMVMARIFSAIYIDRLSGQTLVGLYAAAAAAIEIPTMMWTERVMRRVGGPFTLVLSCLLLGSAYLGLAVIPIPELFLVSALLEGVGVGLFLPAIVRLVANWSPRGQVATYQGVLNAGNSGVAPLVAGLLGGAIFDTSGPQAVFVVSAGAAAAGMVVLLMTQMLGLFSSDLAAELDV